MAKRTTRRSHGGKPGVYDTDRGYIALRKTLLGLKSQAVRVGIRGERGSQRPDPKGPTVAEYATMNEFGTRHVPERSFMRSAFDANEEKYVTRFREGLRLVLDGKATIERFLGLIGLEVVADIQDRIIDGPFVPNALYTIRRKGSSSPLIDTGRMRQSIDFELVQKADKQSRAVRAGAKTSHRLTRAGKRIGKFAKSKLKAFKGRRK